MVSVQGKQFHTIWMKEIKRMAHCANIRLSVAAKDTMVWGGGYLCSVVERFINKVIMVVNWCNEATLIVVLRKTKYL